MQVGLSEGREVVKFVIFGVGLTPDGWKLHVSLARKMWEGGHTC